jgi:hypothetical protein
VYDETGDGQLGQTLGATGDSKAAFECGRDLVATARQAVRTGEDDLVRAIDAYDA